MAFNDRTHTRAAGKYTAVRHHEKPLLHSKQIRLDTPKARKDQKGVQCQK